METRSVISNYLAVRLFVAFFQLTRFYDPCRLHCSCFSCGPDHANILSFGRGSSLCDMIACPVTEDQVCRVRLGWHQAPCQQVQALMSGVMDGLGMLGYSYHGPWSVSGQYWSEVASRVRVTGATLPGVTAHSHHQVISPAHGPA